MEAAELDRQYDVIVVGTGLVESVVAAAAARIGKKVLHIDKNDYYGGQWASFNLQGLHEWVREASNPPPTPPPQQQQQQVPDADETVLAEGESLVAVGDPSRVYYNVNHAWHIPEEAPAPIDNTEEENASPQQEATSQASAPEATPPPPSPTTSPTTSGEAQSDATEETPPTPDMSREDAGASEATANVTGTGATEGDNSAVPPTPPPKPTATEEEAGASEGTQKTTEASSNSTAGDKTKPEESEKVWSQREFLRLSRKFNIDLAPKLLYSRGPMVELLISSNVARYNEFKCITRVLTWMAARGEGESGRLLAVPCSRSDVFTTSAITLVEKRLLMKFLQFCSSYEKHPDQLEAFEEKTFREFLRSRGLTDNLVHFVTSAMAMVGPEEPCRVGLERTRLFLASLGRYGSTPFLFSMYGCGELPQAFCRLCAVFEGTYVLRKPVSHLVLDNGDKRCIGLVAEGQRFGCDNLVMSSDLAPSHYLGDNGTRAELRHISRAILFTNRSILPHKEEQLTFLRLPPTPDNPHPVTVIEVGPGAGVCPQGLYCLQLSCLGKEAEVDLAGAVEKLVGDPDGPTLLWSLYYNQVDVSGCDLVSCSPTSLYLCAGPDASLDYDAAIAQAQSVFMTMFPEETFLPRAPDPEEIIFDNAGAEPKEGDYFGEEGSRGEQGNREGEGQETRGEEGAVSEGQETRREEEAVSEGQEGGTEEAAVSEGQETKEEEAVTEGRNREGEGGGHDGQEENVDVEGGGAKEV